MGYQIYLPGSVVMSMWTETLIILHYVAVSVASL